MTAAVDAVYALTLTVDETFALGLDHAPDPSSEHTIGTHTGSLTATSSPAVSKVFSGTVTLTDGQASLDLTSLAGPMSTTVDFTGLKVQLIKLACSTGNTGGVTIVAKPNVSGITNTGYNLFGAIRQDAVTPTLFPAVRTVTANGNPASMVVPGTAHVLVMAGTVTDGTHTPKLQESVNASDWTDVAAGDQLGTFSGLTTDSGQVVHYIGTQAFLRVVITVSGATIGAIDTATITIRSAKIQAMPGEAAGFRMNDNLQDVDSTHKDLLITGVGSETVDVILVAG